MENGADGVSNFLIALGFPEQIVQLIVLLFKKIVEAFPASVPKTP